MEIPLLVGRLLCTAVLLGIGVLCLSRHIAMDVSASLNTDFTHAFTSTWPKKVVQRTEMALRLSH